MCKLGQTHAIGRLAARPSTWAADKLIRAFTSRLFRIGCNNKPLLRRVCCKETGLGTFIRTIRHFKVDQVIELHCFQRIALHRRLDAPLCGKAAVVGPQRLHLRQTGEESHLNQQIGSMMWVNAAIQLQRCNLQTASQELVCCACHHISVLK